MRQIILILLLNIFSFADNGPSKEQLHNMLLNTLPESMCKENLIFTACYSVTIQDCKTLVAQSVTPCLYNLKIKLMET